MVYLVRLQSFQLSSEQRGCTRYPKSRDAQREQGLKEVLNRAVERSKPLLKRFDPVDASQQFGVLPYDIAGPWTTPVNIVLERS